MLDWRYHVTVRYDIDNNKLIMKENGIAQFPGTEDEWKNFIKSSRQMALYWIGREYEIFPKRLEGGTITTDVRPSKREEARVKQEQKDFRSWMIE